MMDINEVSQAIKELANANGYDFFPGTGGPRKDNRGSVIENVLCGTVQSQKGDNRPLLNLIVTIGSNHFRVTLETSAPKKANDLDQLLDIIKEWLLNKKE